MTKEEKAKAKSDLQGHFNSVQAHFDKISKNIEACKDWPALGSYMALLMDTLVESGDPTQHRLYGTIVREFCYALAQGGTTDAEIIAGRMVSVIKGKTNNLIKELYHEMMETLENEIEEIEEDGSTGSKN